MLFHPKTKFNYFASTVNIFYRLLNNYSFFWLQATIFLGISLVVSNLWTLFVANKMPRRAMLIFSTFGISSALIGMGVYFHFKGLEEKLCLNGLSGNGTTSISTLSTNGTGKTDVTRRYLKSVNLQYNTLVRWDDGTNESSTKSLMFHVFFYTLFRLRALKTLFFIFVIL